MDENSMSYSSTDIDYTTIAGCFKNKETGKTFEYRKNPINQPNYPHEVFVGDGSTAGNSTRLARVMNTVAYVVVDEDEFGQYVVEKWDIKTEWSRKERGATQDCNV